MKKRKLYPRSRIDRFSFWAMFFNASASTVYVVNGNNGMAIFHGIFACFSFVMAYVLQDTSYSCDDGRDEYGEIITKISQMTGHLSELSAFLKREQQKVATTKALINGLVAEKETLEPIVSEKRKNVDAILSAYTTRVATNVWKERIISFILGIFASMLAGYFLNILA